MKQEYAKVRVDQYLGDQRQASAHYKTLREAARVVGEAASKGDFGQSWSMYPAPGLKVVVECGNGVCHVEYSTPTGASHREVKPRDVQSYLRGLCQ